MYETLMDYAQECLISILLALLSYGSVLIIMYINRLKNKAIVQADLIEETNLKKLITDSINRVDSTVITVVKSIEQELASEIRKKLESGDTSVTRNDLVKLRDYALEEVKSLVSNEVLELAKYEISDVDEYILNKISEEVKDIKDGTASLSSYSVDSN